MCRKKTCKTIARPPTGRLIQKHQRQVTSQVKTPPRTGPRTVAVMTVAVMTVWH